MLEHSTTTNKTILSYDLYFQQIVSVPFRIWLVHIWLYSRFFSQEVIILTLLSLTLRIISNTSVNDSSSTTGGFFMCTNFEKR